MSCALRFAAKHIETIAAIMAVVYGVLCFCISLGVLNLFVRMAVTFVRNAGAFACYLNDISDIEKSGITLLRST